LNRAATMPCSEHGNQAHPPPRRFARGATLSAKKIENHEHAMQLHFMRYNFVLIHQTLRCTLATAAGGTVKFWELAHMAKVLEKWEASLVTE
jgi:hypothetical protein